jgi:hypothetical protein
MLEETAPARLVLLRPFADAKNLSITLVILKARGLMRFSRRLADDNWHHDRRKKRTTTHEYTPEEAGTYVTTEEDDKKKKNGIQSEEALSDASYKQYEDELCNAWRMKK